MPSSYFVNHDYTRNDRKRISVRNERHGFTLIELLVVIAVISLLVSILLPSLQQAKMLAKQVTCMGNVKGMGLAVAMYANDSDGRFPNTRYDVDGDEYFETPWEIYITEKEYCAMGLFHCPSAAENDPYIKYGYCFGLNPNVAQKQSNILPNPFSTCLIGDGWNIVQYELYGISYYKYGYALRAESSTSYGGKPDFRHIGGCNVLFCDLHVETLPRDKIPTDKTELFWDGTKE